MTEAIYEFPVTWRPQVNTKRLVQMRLDDEFIKVIDIWRGGQTDRPARTEAIRRLAAIGLADQMLRAARRRKKTIAPPTVHTSAP